jgi:hypothetical protein
MDHGTGCTCLLLFLWFFAFWALCFANRLLAISGASNSTISGWADVLEAIYNDIGGSFSSFCVSLLLFLRFLRLVCHQAAFANT